MEVETLPAVQASTYIMNPEPCMLGRLKIALGGQKGYHVKEVA